MANEHDDDRNEDRRHPPKYLREISWSVAISAAALGLGAGKFVLDQHSLVLNRFSDHGARISVLERNAIEQARLGNANQLAMQRIEIAVAELRAVPDARADPFTGTDGDRLETRIRELERKQAR